MAKRPLDIENKENESEQGSSTEFNLPKRVRTDTVNVFECNSSDESDNDDDEEEEGPLPIGLMIQHYDGRIYPPNKQYFIYKDAEPDMISKTARFWSRKYLKVLKNVDPDAYDLYVHNDFVCYGELEVIENCIIDIAKGIFLKHKNQLNFSNYIFAFRRLEALTILLNSSNNFVGIDDGFRFIEFIRVIGSCYITILRGLLPKAMFNDDVLNDDDIKKLNKIYQQLPNFKQVIKQALILGHCILTIGDIRSAYINILHTIYCKWSIVMDKIVIDLNEKPSEEDELLWKALKQASGLNKSAYKESFNFMKEYDHYAKTYPDLGGNSHDLRKWPKAKKDLYSINNIDDENFWLRL